MQTAFPALADIDAVLSWSTDTAFLRSSVEVAIDVNLLRTASEGTTDQ